MPASGPLPTMKEVAARAGTSIATVSYVLNNKSRYLRAELRDQVMAAARELGYVKNAAASSLKGQRRGILAVLVPQFGNNFFTRICVEIETVAQQAGFIVTICNSDENPAQERAILERLIAQRIDGCIISPALSQTDTLGLLRQHGVPTIVLERSFGETLPAADFVGHDNFQSGALAAEALLAAGHRRLAFLGWESPIPNIHDRARGFAHALAAAGLSAGGHVLLDTLTEAGGRRLADRLAALDVTGAVIAHHHDMAKGVLLRLIERGLRWPQDRSLVLIGTPEWRDLIQPPLACVGRPEQAMGQEAARALLRRIERPDETIPAVILPNLLVPGGSIAPPGAARTA